MLLVKSWFLKHFNSSNLRYTGCIVSKNNLGEFICIYQETWQQMFRLQLKETCFKIYAWHKCYTCHLLLSQQKSYWFMMLESFWTNTKYLEYHLNYCVCKIWPASGIGSAICPQCIYNTQFISGRPRSNGKNDFCFACGLHKAQYQYESHEIFIPGDKICPTYRNEMQNKQMKGSSEDSFSVNGELVYFSS